MCVCVCEREREREPERERESLSPSGEGSALRGSKGLSVVVEFLSVPALRNLFDCQVEVTASDSTC